MYCCLQLLLALIPFLMFSRSVTALRGRSAGHLPKIGRFGIETPQIPLYVYRTRGRSLCSLSSSSSSEKVNYYDDSGLQKLCGTYKLLNSESNKVQRSFVEAKNLGTANGPKYDESVWLRGRVANVRMKGNMCFIVLRCSAFYTVQVCYFKDSSKPEDSAEMLKFLGELKSETIVDIQGIVKPGKVKSCTQQNVELHIQRAFVVAKPTVTLPFVMDDAMRSISDIEQSQGTDRPLAGVSQDLRLNNRWLDLRVPANNAILRIRSGISLLFREFLDQQGFTEINTPKLISGASEGGSEVFRTDYFGKPACLAQSPQLYKQMGISSDLGRVFEIGPVFRAEKSMTRRHLCEFTGLDMEMEIKNHYHEVLHVLHDMFRHIFEGLEKRYAPELKAIRTQYPSSPVKFSEKPLILQWKDAIAMLREAGQDVDEMGDLSSPDEVVLGKLVQERYDGAEFFMLDGYPSTIRPFYTMPAPHDSNFSNSYDFFLRGQEICSGAQRCHDPDLLLSRMHAKGLIESVDAGFDEAQEGLKAYLTSFQHGCAPHAGAGIGLDRVVFLYLGLDNVRKASMFPRDPTRCSP